MEKLSKDVNEDIRKKVSRNTSTPTEALTKISNDSSNNVVQGVGENPSTASNVLKEMWAKNQKWSLPSWAAKNPSLPLETIKLLSQNDDSGTKGGIAENLHTPVDILVRLSYDLNATVRKSVASNPNTPANTLEILSIDKGHNKKRTKNMLEKLKSLLGIGIENSYMLKHYSEKSDESYGQEIRQHVAVNPNTSIETLKNMLNDDYWYVIDLAKRSLKERGIES